MTDTTLPALLEAGALPTPDLADRLRAYAQAAEGALADNTRRALLADLRIFSAKCAAERRDPLPASPEMVAAFVDAMAATKAPTTVRRYRASIVTLHRTAGVPDPTKAEVVRLAVERMHRAKGSRQAQADPLVRAAVDRMLQAADAGGRPIDRRDAALLAVA
ncbi:site-specific integrase [Azospirillum sp. SYSU D00513]|uniref:site-specific integrase n=1 Tax=Azospirillum sp. SYSU D00513 TaxID=2812561 RepID=UPI001A96BCA3|nr:site-specific integrase [Azospirillum sp. SYSU D00513]